MRILIVTEMFVPVSDGLITRLIEAVRYFQKEGHQVAILTLNRGIERFENTPIYRVRTNRLPFMKKVSWVIPSREVFEIMEDFSPDVVHVANPVVLGSMAIKYANELRLPLVVSYHTNIRRYLRYYHLDKALMRKIARGVEKYFYKNATVTVCTSRALRTELLSRGAEQVHVLKRGVDIERFKTDYASQSMRAILNNGQEEKKLLVYVGRLSKGKRIESLVPIMKRRKDICLAIIGDGPEKAKLESSFAGTSTVFTGYLQGKTLSEVYASADAVIFPTTEETVGLSILEAMASGTPVIAAHSLLTDEQFLDGRDIFLYDSQNEGSLDYAINCLEDVELVQRICHVARKETENSTWEHASQQLLDYYHIARARATRFN